MFAVKSPQICPDTVTGAASAGDDDTTESAVSKAAEKMPLFIPFPFFSASILNSIMDGSNPKAVIAATKGYNGRMEKEQLQERGFKWRDKPSARRIALVFPNRYSLGMSNLGFQVIYKLINETDGFVCERFFLSEKNAKALSLETGRRLKEFDAVAFSLSFELDYPNAVRILLEAGISRESDIVLLAGGPAVTANPEPMADFFDLFLLGEAEKTLPPFLEALEESRGRPKKERLKKFSSLPGCYVPALYEWAPAAERLAPIDEAPPAIERQWCRDFGESVILTPNTEFADTFLVETSRGCAHGCRFCLAGSITRPFRCRSLDSLKESIERGLSLTEKIGLLGAAVSDLPDIDGLTEFLLTRSLRLYISSIRADKVTPRLIQLLRHGGLKSLTIAPEAGSEEGRRRIKKGIGEADILRAVELAGEGGLSGVKLYFMLGLPGREKESEEIPLLLEKVVKAGRACGIRHFSTDVHPFVPKAHTPFQWEEMEEISKLEKTILSLGKPLAKLGVKLRGDSPKWAHVQEVLARGDRSTSNVLRSVVEGGGALGAWRKALEGMPPRFFEPGKPLPWDHIKSGPPPAFLLEERLKAKDWKGGADG